MGLTQLIAGIADNGGFAPNGGGSRQDNTYLMDGVNITNPLFGYLSTEVNELDIAEVNIKRAGISAEERIALFKLAWDVTGESFGQRMAQYVRFYSGDPIRLTAGFYAQYDKQPLFEIVERALGRRDGLPIPISPADAGAPVPYQPGTRGMAGTYAATSLPTGTDPRP